MRLRDDLVIDVGLHNGDDTAYYLYKGFNVVAIDANPAMVERARHRFADELLDGRLILLNAGITSTAGEQDFYVAEDFSEWSSFDEINATKGGNAARKIHVSGLRFEDVLSEHGIPHYLKIDIEGHDHLCVDALEPGALPTYLSLEMSHRRGDADIRALAGLGYSRFKCIRQNDFRPFTPENIGRRSRFRRLASRPDLLGKMLRTGRTIRSRMLPPHDGKWRFRPGSSGGFGERLGGRWMTAAETLAVWEALRDIDRELASGGLGEWFDIHATTP